jgi:hypothetical protein
MADARIDPLVRSFERSLRAERKSERTIDTDFETLEQLSALLHQRERGLADATADIQDYIIEIIERRRPSTANNRFRALHRFYAWLEDEEEIPNPMFGGPDQRGSTLFATFCGGMSQPNSADPALLRCWQRCLTGVDAGCGWWA